MERKVNDFGYAMEVLGCKPFIKKKKVLFYLPNFKNTIYDYNCCILKPVIDKM